MTLMAALHSSPAVTGAPYHSRAEPWPILWPSCHPDTPTWQRGHGSDKASPQESWAAGLAHGPPALNDTTGPFPASPGSGLRPRLSEDKL